MMARRQHSSPMKVSPPSIDTNNDPPSPDQSLASSVSSTIPTTTVVDTKKEEDKSKRSRRRRKVNKPSSTMSSNNGGNNSNSNSKVESIQTDKNYCNRSSSSSNNNISTDSPSAFSASKKSPRSQRNWHNNQIHHQPSPRQVKQQHKTSTFRTPIVSWRNSSSNQRRRNNNNSNSNNNNNNYYHQQYYQQQQPSLTTSSSPYKSNNNNRNYYNHHNQQQHTHSSPRHDASGTKQNPSPSSVNSTGNSNSNGAASCSASMGFPTSKKQHDAPMKKRDLYFSVHVETIGIAAATTPPAVSGRMNETGQQQRSDNFNNDQEQTAAARVTLLNWENEIVLDTFMIVPGPVTDFFATGIRSTDVQQPVAGVDDNNDSSFSCIHPFTDVRSKIEQILKGKILIGYKLDEALQSLRLTHPKSDMRDCLSYFSSPSSSMLPSSSSSLEDISNHVLNQALESVKVFPTATATNTATSSILPANAVLREDTMTMRLTDDDKISRRPIQICVTTIDLYKKHRQQWEETLIAEARDRDQKQQNHLDMITRQRQQEQQQQQQQQQMIQQQQIYINSLPNTISLHCDFVRTAISGLTKSLARVVVVDGPTRNVLLNDFVQISAPVTDFCDTGITSLDVKIVNCSESNNKRDNSAKPLQLLRIQVQRLLRGRILVGYKVEEDLKALGVVYPWTHIRDTAYFPPFLRGSIVGGSRVVTVRTLDELSEEFLRRCSVPPGDKSRSTDLCRTVLYLYETFRDQWERQQEETYRLQCHQQQQQGRRMPASSPSSAPVTPHHSPNHQKYQHYRQHQHQPVDTSQDVASTMISSPLFSRQLAPHRQPSMPEQQDRGSPSTNSSSWFAWVKQYQNSQTQTQPGSLSAASSVLSSQALQLLQEDPANEQISSQASLFLQHDNCSSTSYLDSSMHGDHTATDRTFEGSMVSGDDSRIGCIQNMETSAFMPIGSTLRSDASSVFSSDQASSIVGSTSPKNNDASSSLLLQNDASSSSASSDQASSIVESPSLPEKTGASSTSSSWFRFGSRKSRCSFTNEKKKHCESMDAVEEESEVLNDDIIMRPITLFSLPEGKGGKAGLECTPEAINEGEQQASSSAETSLSLSSHPTIPSRSWLRFRRSSNSPGRKERSRSPPSTLNNSDGNLSARPQVSDDAIEITLSIPSPLENEDSVSPLAEKSSLTSRPSSSWLNFRRSRKSSNSKNITSNTATDQSTKTPDTAYLTKQSVPSLVPSSTERTATMDEDWFQEVMSMSSTGGDTVDTSRDQSSWFGFKWSKQSSSANKASRLVNVLDSENGNGTFDGTAWHNQQNSDVSWMPDGVSHPFEKKDLNTIIIDTNSEHNNIDDVFRNRARISTESTILSVATEPLEEESYSDSDEFANGAAQSFNFLKI